MPQSLLSLLRFSCFPRITAHGAAASLSLIFSSEKVNSDNFCWPLFFFMKRRIFKAPLPFSRPEYSRVDAIINLSWQKNNVGMAGAS